EKRGPYIMSKPPSVRATLQRQRELAKAALRRQGLLGGPAPHHPKPVAKRSVKFNKGYTALSQTPDENLVSLDSDSPSWLPQRGRRRALSCEGVAAHGVFWGARALPPFFPPQQVNQDLSRQLLQDGYHLDEVPDDEDLDLIPPKPVTSSSCPSCFGDSLSCVVQ
ncbi:Protein FAM219B, partial [Tauraco erythrolophus]